MKKNKFIFCNIVLLLVICSSFARNVDYSSVVIDCKEDYWISKVEKSRMQIIASSTLPPSGVYNYDPENLIDNNKKTCWCPKGKGINEFIILKIPWGCKGFEIINGVSSSKELYKQNNRVKGIYWGIIAEKPKETGMSYDACLNLEPGKIFKYHIIYHTLYKPDNLKLKDIMETQRILFSDDAGFDWNIIGNKNLKNLYLVIRILDVYKGTKYNDTCLTELKIIK